MNIPSLAHIAAAWEQIAGALLPVLALVAPGVRSGLGSAVRSLIPRKPAAPSLAAAAARTKNVWDGPPPPKPSANEAGDGAKKKFSWKWKRGGKDHSARDLRRFFRHEARRYRSVVGGTRNLYDAPWYLLVGEAGSGKSALVGASSQYPWSEPYAEKFPGAALCSWWCSDRAVVLDACGDLLLRSDGSFNARAWRMLLRLVRHHHYRRPIDGVIVTIAVTDLVGDARLAPEMLALKGEAILARLQEIERMLGMRVPVYTVFTKCDRLPGFGTFCELLPERRRDEMFGWSNPYTMESGYSAQWIEEAFREMASVLSDAQLEILSELPAGSDGDGLFLFPSAFAELLDGVREYSNQIFRLSGGAQAPLMMRGIYFTGDGADGHGDIAAGDAAPGNGVAQPVNGAPVPDSYATPPGTAPANGTANGTANGAANGNGAAAGVPANGVSDDAAEAAPPGRAICFARMLFEGKIFPEHSLAYPLRERGLSRNRMKLVLQIAVVLVCLLGLVGGFAEYPRLDRSGKNIREVLETTAENLDRVSDGRGLLPADYVHFAEQLLDGIYTIDTSRMISPLYPSSWVSPLHGEIHHAMVVAFNSIIVRAMHARLVEKTNALIRYHGDTLRSDAQSENHAIELTTEFTDLKAFVAELTGLEQHARQFNNLHSTRRLQDAMELVRYLFGRELSPGFVARADYYHSALDYYDTIRFDAAPYDSALTGTAGVFLTRLRDRLFDNNEILSYVRAIDADLATLVADNGANQSGITTMTRLRDRINLLKRALLDPATAWISRPHFEPDSVLRRLMADLDSSAFIRKDGLPANLGAAFLKSCDDRFQRLKDLIRRDTSGVLNASVVETEAASGALVLAPVADTLQMTIGAFMAQPFMRGHDGARLYSRRTRGNLVLWNADQLTHAARLGDPYDTFMDNGLLRFPEKTQNAIQSLARRGLNLTISEMIDPAQQATPSNGTLIDIKREVENLQSVAPAFDKILGLFSRLQLSGYDDLRQAIAAQGDSILGDLSRLRDERRLYMVEDQLFKRVGNDSSQSPGAVLLDAPDAAQIAEHLAPWHEQIRTYANSVADPVLAILDKVGGGQSEREPEWKVIITELHRFDDKAPKNSVAMLEDLFLSLNDINEENYTRMLVARPQRDYFLMQREKLRRELYWAFQRSIIARVHARYEALRSAFAKDVGASQPFEDFNIATTHSPLTAADMREYFDSLDRFVANDRGEWKHWNDPDSSRAYHAAYNFIDSMLKVRAFLAPLLRTDTNHVPVFMLDVDLHANFVKELGAEFVAERQLKVGNQTLNIADQMRHGKLPPVPWKLGEPIQLMLRWVNVGTVTPLRATTGTCTINKEERRVIYRFNDPVWSLLHLLNIHRAPAAHIKDKNAQPQILEFEVTTTPGFINNVLVSDTMRLFIRISILSENGKDIIPMPAFPNTVPPKLPTINPP